MSEHTGSCLCGGIRYVLHGDPLLSAVCHCKNCQKASGSAFCSNLFYSKENFEITKGENLIKEYKDNNTTNGNTVERHFCSNCGSPLFSSNEESDFVKGKVIIMSGALDGTLKEEFNPKYEIFCDSARGWTDVNVPVQKFPKGI